MARIMVIAGGTWQCPIIKLAKSMGHYVICSNLYEDSPAFAYADVGEVADVLDKEKNLQLAMKYQPDAVLTDQTDIAVPTVAYIAEKLGIKGISVDIARRFTNKYLMRQCVEETGFASPKYRRCSAIQEAKEFFEENGICIIKPLDSQSSRGIHIINRPEDIDLYFADCIQYSNCEEAIMVEEYIDGTEFTVDGIKTEGGYIVTAISEKEHYLYNQNVAKRLMFSHDNERFDYEELRRINTAIVEAMGLPFGITHAEYKYAKGKFYLIEIAARGGGTKISSDIVPLVSGINSNEIYIHTLLDEPIQITEGIKKEYAVLGFFDFKPGRIIEISGLEEAQRMEGIYEVKMEVCVGDVLAQALDDRSRCGYYIIYADSKKELEERETLLKNTVRVVTE